MYSNYMYMHYVRMYVHQYYGVVLLYTYVGSHFRYDVNDWAR